MTRLARRYARATGLGAVVIAGKTYDVNYARLVFRCEVCHGELKRRNHGLVCATDESHRGFIHQRELVTEDKLKTNLAEIEDGIWKPR